MIRKCHWAGIVLVVSAGMLGGCSQAMTDGFFAETVTDSRKFHDVTWEAVKHHDTNMTEQHKKMHPEAATELDKFKAEFNAKVEELKKRGDDIHSSVVENAKKIVEAALQVAAGFANVPEGESIAQMLNDVVGTETGKVRTAMLAGFREVREDIDAEGARRRDEIAAMEAEIRRTGEARLTQLKEETQVKLASVSTEAMIELEKLRGDNKAFREKLQAAAKLADAEMDALKGLSTEEIMAMLLAAAGAAGAGGALGKTGKSRGAGEIEKLKDAIDKITTDAALFKKAPGTSGT